MNFLVNLGTLCHPRFPVAPRLEAFQHGCRTFMIAVLLGMVGLVLARR